MELFEIRKNVRIKISLGIWWVKWLNSRVGQGYIFHVYSCTLYFLVKILLVIVLKNFYTSACLKLNYCTTKRKLKMLRLQRQWNLSKLVTSTLVNFANFFNSIILSPSFLLRKKYLQKTLFGRNWQFLSAWGIMIKTWESFTWGHD